MKEKLIHFIQIMAHDSISCWKERKIYFYSFHINSLPIPVFIHIKSKTKNTQSCLLQNFILYIKCDYSNYYMKIQELHFCVLTTTTTHTKQNSNVIATETQYKHNKCMFSNILCTEAHKHTHTHDHITFTYCCRKYKYLF